MHIFRFFFNVFLCLISMIYSNVEASQWELVKYYWVQIGPESKRFFRVLSTANRCPVIKIDGRDIQMSLHVGKDRSFSLTSCISSLDAKDSSVQLPDGNKVDVAVKKIEKILVVGDTGCRVANNKVQDCKKEWYFKKIMENGLKHQPDLIIHLGDYYYREKCVLDGRCRYENTGDNLRTWEDEFFHPAYLALSSGKPWIMLRGNHEACNRGGLGWTHFLDFSNKCTDKNDDFLVDLKDHNLKMLIMDSSSKVNVVKNDDFGVQNLWILTHVPFEPEELAKLPKNLRLVLSGHEHRLRMNEINGVLHAVVGNSGAKLWDSEQDSSIYEYGFAIISRNSEGWLFTGYNYDDIILTEHKVKN